jgi:hypothetical protein
MALKWTVNLTRPEASGSEPLGPFVLHYAISGTTDSPDPLQGGVTIQPGTPQSDITTYVLPMSTSVSTLDSDSTTATTTKTIVALVQLFDRAKVDGEWATVTHSIVRRSAPGSARPVYAVELRLPAFTRSLHYDPSVNFGALLGSTEESREGESSGGSDNMGLIVAVAVVVPIAVLLVITTITVVVAIAWHRKRRAIKANLKRRSVVNFNDL